MMTPEIVKASLSDAVERVLENGGTAYWDIDPDGKPTVQGLEIAARIKEATKPGVRFEVIGSGDRLAAAGLAPGNVVPDPAGGYPNVPKSPSGGETFVGSFE